MVRLYGLFVLIASFTLFSISLNCHAEPKNTQLAVSESGGNLVIGDENTNTTTPPAQVQQQAKETSQSSSSSSQSEKREPPPSSNQAYEREHKDDYSVKPPINNIDYSVKAPSERNSDEPVSRTVRVTPESSSE